ncbi:PilW family protein [Methylobacillus arboreus]|uniref:PilW family protein n=1 Tax=Methylobacillus arboreus TaxID=755170 RepID=UPI001E5B5C4D|nr:PilW family protein [Methylobacillus arboreus]MCB5190743.1 PilW family protein [Methylobacillus arboreus]
MNTIAIHRHHSGYSLVEIMVGMTIGLLGLMVIAQVLSISQDSNRTTSSGGNAQQNGALALLAIERDIRQSGYGMNVSQNLGCQVVGTDSSTGREVRFLFTPAVITQGLDTAPDVIQLTYSNASMVTSPSALMQTMANADADYVVSNRFGFTVNDLVVAAAPGQDCDLAQITATPGNPYQNNITHAATARYRGSQIYSSGAQIYNMGKSPASNRYSIVDGGLQVFSEITGEAELIADGIVDLQADYGINLDADTENTVDEYRASPDLDGNGVVSWDEWEKVIAVRVALVSRSGKKETANVTTELPSWTGGVFSNVSNLADWQQYRYRVFETTVVIRNILWKPPA